MPCGNKRRWGQLYLARVSLQRGRGKNRAERMSFISRPGVPGRGATRCKAQKQKEEWWLYHGSFFQLQATEAVVGWLNGNEFFIKKSISGVPRMLGGVKGQNYIGEQVRKPLESCTGSCGNHHHPGPTVPVLSKDHDLTTTPAPEDGCFCSLTQWQSRFYTIILRQVIHF